MHEETVAHSNPEFCDVIMKGGTASAIVYPPLLATLAGRDRPFRLRNLAGTSAGSIGAVFGAAAEYRRHTQDGSTEGFDRLDQFVNLIHEKGGILPLFEPSEAARPLWEAIWALRSGPGVAGRVALVEKLVAAFAPDLLTGLAVGMAFTLAVAMLVLVRPDWLMLALLATALCLLVWGVKGWPTKACLGLTALASLLALGKAMSTLTVGWPLAAVVAVGGLAGAPIGALCRAVRVFCRVLPEQGYGICPGARLTQWLHEQVQETAGLKDAPPLTFADLETRCLFPDGHLQLAMLTTCLSQRRPYELPFRSRIWYFDPDELRPLVGDAIVEALLRPRPEPKTELSRDEPAAEDEVRTPDGKRLYPLPVKQLPVALAMRMSMALPMVLSAVPLWTRRFTCTKDAAGQRSWQTAYERMWMSDGGTTSNLPVHLFDTMVPRWPTVTINLDYSPEPRDPAGAWMAPNNRGGILPPFFAIGGTLQFLTGLFETARNWQDSTQLTAPGQRDRIANVWLSAEQGGMNLNMSLETMTDVAAKARAAGELLIQIGRAHV